jgi:drug/metabolite transporter (DMT)-like permease
VFLAFLAIYTIGMTKGSVISNTSPVFAAAGGYIVLKE